MKGQKRVLLTDDNEDCLTVYRIILEHGGFEVIEARTGVEAIEQARAMQPDLILMDVSLPLLDGWAATVALKSEASTRDIPVIALTAHALRDDRVRAREVGCQGFLPKPVSPAAVLSEVRSILERLPAPPS